VTAIFSVGLMALSAAFCATMEPWISGPDESRAEIDERWSQLRERVAPQSPAGDPRPLIKAVAVLAESSVYPRRGIVRDLDPGIELDESARQAIDLLVGWDRRGGGVGTGPCLDPRLSSFALLGLARVALSVAESPADPRFVASVRLARSLRDRGGSISWLVSGSTLVSALERVEAEGWEVPAVLYEARPLATEVPVNLARGVVCWEGELPGSLTASTSPEHLGQSPLEDFVARTAFDMERERLFLRAEYGRRLMLAVASDGREQVLEAVRSPPRDQEVPSLVIRSLFDNLPRIAEMAYDSVERYDDTLRRVAQRPRSPRGTQNRHTAPAF